MSLNCEIVMDLSAMYHDGSASEESVKAIDEHLAGCSECRRFYREYKAMLKRGHDSGPIADAPESDFSKIALKLKQRHVMLMTGVIVYSCVLAGAATYLLIRSDYERIRLGKEQVLRQAKVWRSTIEPIAELPSSLIGRIKTAAVRGRQAFGSTLFPR